MDYIKTLTLTGFMLSLQACATLGSPENTQSVQDKTLQTNGLQPRRLSDGECGLFVWAGEDRAFVLFSQNGTQAVFSRDKKEIPLIVIESGSKDQFGQVPNQIFADISNRRYELSLSGAKRIEKGLQYTSGLLRYKDKEGWDLVKAAYGVSTCLSETQSNESVLFKPARSN